MIAHSKRKAASRKKAPSRKLDDAPADPETTDERTALIKRMWRAADAQVREIENHLRHDNLKPLERERDVRVLAVLAKTLRELSALDETQQGTQTAPADDDAVPRDMDELRRSLARKLETLVAGGAPAVSGES